SLKAFCVSDVRCHDFSAGQEDGRCGGNSDRGTAFEGGDRIDCPTQASDPFRPVESVGGAIHGGPIGFSGITRIVDEQYLTRVLRFRGEKEDSLTSLRQSEGSGIDDTICPVVSLFVEGSREVTHRLAA